MLDALAPAARAARLTLDRGGDLDAVMAAAAAAARQGAASTAGMRAMAGRARYAEAGAIGTRDPGAESVALILGAWSAMKADR
jgi:dihydroxyacetone kinase-like protein